MTSKTTQAGSRFAPAPLARVLAFVLLAFVTHSATLEVVHQHGNILAASSAYSASFVDVSTDHSSTESSGSTGECLICQLHQHLFSTLLISIPGIAPPQSEEAIATHTTVSSPSESSAPTRGRAPPQGSLL
ncbi:MAG: hypothetical protein ICV60_12545 [Pyrinomonadaceae bacterium]|nr:hypothetical protein [Pyrinomonadaceae bacterium]